MSLIKIDFGPRKLRQKKQCWCNRTHAWITWRQKENHRTHARNAWHEKETTEHTCLGLEHMVRTRPSTADLRNWYTACKPLSISVIGCINTRAPGESVVLEIRAICHDARDLLKLARSWKQLCLLCPPDLWNLPGIALLSGSRGALKSTE